MKLVSYRISNSLTAYRIGAFYKGKVTDLNEAYRQMKRIQQEEDSAYAADQLLPPTPGEFFALGELGMQRARETYNFLINEQLTNVSYGREQVTLGPPVPNPSKIICVGKNYLDHVEEMDGNAPDFPVLFAKFNNALIGPDDDIKKSPITNKLDYEVELAVVIGKEATNVKEEEALNYVAGYTIGNDTSARDLQKRTPQWLQGKSMDKSTPIGPWVVTTDELKDPTKLDVKSYVNGELRQSSNTKHLIFNLRHLIAFISEIMTLQPGDIILTGTPDGVGFAMDPPQFLKDGDQITMEIEGIGKLENKIVEYDK